MLLLSSKNKYTRRLRKHRPATTILEEGSAPGRVATNGEGHEGEEAASEEYATHYLHPDWLNAGGAIADEHLGPLTVTVSVLAGEPTDVVQFTLTAHSTVVTATALDPLTTAIHWNVKELTEAVVLL